MFYTEPMTLIVVYKDELLVNQIKKLVETNDDKNAETTVGTKDGTVNIVSWTEKVWLEQKKAGNINNKVLFLGDIKGTDKLIPIIDIQFEEYGVKYGWAGSQAVIFIEPKAIKSKAEYDAFFEKLCTLPVPDSIKVSQAAPEAPDKQHSGFKGFWGNLSANAAVLAHDIFSDKAMVRRQMLFYGIINLYNNHLETFMQS